MILNSILILVLIICFITDLRVERIYNKVIFPALAVVIFVHAVFYGFNGIKLSFLGLITGLAILLIPYLMGGIGAGDVKLLALIGAIKGSLFVFNTAIYMGLIGGAIAIAIIVMSKERIKIIKIFFSWIVSLFHGNIYKLEFSTTGLLKLFPYGLAITGGAFICLIFEGGWII